MSDPHAPLPDDPNFGQSPPDQPPASATARPLSETEDRLWASLAHLGGIFSFVPSLIIWLVFKDRGRFTAEEAKEALNFQITLVIGYLVIWVVAAFLAVVTFGFGSLFGLLAWVLWILSVVFSVIGFLQAKDGHPYRYPFNARLIK